MAKKNGEGVPVKAKVLIVDDHPVVREGLAMHLATQPDLEVCGEAEDLPGRLGLARVCSARRGDHRHFAQEQQRNRTDPADQVLP